MGDPAAATGPEDRAGATPSDLIYGLHDRPPFLEASLVGLQHVLAVFVGIVTPPLIVGSALGLDLQDVSYIVGMSLFVSGVATFIQTRRFGPVGSGLLSVQGTSFAFLAPIIAAATVALGTGAGTRAALAAVFGVCFAGAFVEIGLSRVLGHARRVVTPLVSGIVVTLIGLTLLQVGAETFCGGPAAREDGSFASLQNLGLGGLVLVVIVALNRTRCRFLRMSSIALGLAAGCAVSLLLGLVDLGRLSALGTFGVPVPFKYGFGFSWSALVPVAFVYVITTIETGGDHPGGLAGDGAGRHLRPGGGGQPAAGSREHLQLGDRHRRPLRPRHEPAAPGGEAGRGLRSAVVSRGSSTTPAITVRMAPGSRPRIWRASFPSFEQEHRVSRPGLDGVDGSALVR